MSDRIFYPVSSRDYAPVMKPGQRYRHPFGDLRLSRGIEQLGNRMSERGTIVVNQLSEEVSEKDRFYKLLNNPYVEISELIDHSCRISPELVEEKSLLCLLDTTSTSLISRIQEKEKSSPSPGVVEDNRTPGFYGHSCLVVEEYSKYVIGLGDLVIYDRPKNNLSSSQKAEARIRRAKLPIEQKESYVWPLAAANTSKRLQNARQLTYVLDQGGDNYEGLLALRKQTGGADFILRCKENRLAVNVLSGLKARLTIH